MSHCQHDSYFPVWLLVKLNLTPLIKIIPIHLLYRVVGVLEPILATIGQAVITNI